MSAAAPALAATGKTASPTRTIVTICAMIATLMQALDNTIANVALPYMQGTFSTTLDQITWVLTSYIVAAAIMTAPVGWLAARFGRKNFFVACVTGFTVASILCGLAETLPQMVVFRLLQGMFGAALVPLSQVTMLDLYPIEQRGNAMAIWGMGVMVGPILGPTLGGYLTDIYNWRWVFYINLPFGIVAAAGLWLFMQDTGRNSRLQFDWTGFAVLSLGIGALQLMLDRGEQLDWFGSTEIMIEAVLAGLGTYLFIVHMLTADKPFIPPALFRDANFVSGILVMLAMGMVLLASSALLAPYLQNLSGYSVSQAGLLMVPRGVGTMIAMLIAGRSVNRIDPRLLILAGVVMLAGTMWEMAGWTPNVSAWSLTVTTLIQGVGLGFVFIPLNVISFGTLPPELRTDGTAMFSLMRNVGGAIGISITSFLLAQNTQIIHARIAEQVTPFNRMLQSGGAYLFWNMTKPQGLAALNTEITRQAQIMAYANDFMLMFLVSLTVALLLLFMRRPKMRTMPAEHGLKQPP
jgi:DHA2 family multidrug resistance protein